MAKVRPLKVNGFAKSKLIPIRTIKHPSATPAAFKARARLYRLLEPARPRWLEDACVIYGTKTRNRIGENAQIAQSLGLDETSSASPRGPGREPCRR